MPPISLLSWVPRARVVPVTRRLCAGGLLVLAVVAGGAPARAADPASSAIACGEAEARATAARVQGRYDRVVDIAADFEQVSESAVLSGAALASSEPSRGTVVFAKPGRMHWRYREPEPSEVISDGKVMWIFDETAKEASRYAVADGYLAGAALQFLLGDGKLSESFAIGAERCGEGFVELSLLPLAPASYERLGLRADPETGLISETTIFDLFGGRTRIRFSNLRENLSPAAEEFRFELPEGVELIELGSP